MRNRNTIEFLGVWEELHNLEFNRVQFEAVKRKYRAKNYRAYNRSVGKTGGVQVTGSGAVCYRQE